LKTYRPNERCSYEITVIVLHPASFCSLQRHDWQINTKYCKPLVGISPNLQLRCSWVRM